MVKKASMLKLVAVTAIVIMVAVLTPGCSEKSLPEIPYINQYEKDKPASTVEIRNIWDDVHQVAAGQMTTFVFTVKNKSDAKDNVTVEFKDIPQGMYPSFFKNSTFELEVDKEIGFLVVVNVTGYADEGSHDLTLEAHLVGSPDERADATVTIEVIKNKFSTAKYGKNVQVEYIGYLDDGRIFDTSVSDVGLNTNIPKGSGYSRSTFQPLPFVVGKGSVVKGFDTAMDDLELGMSKTVLIPPELGYGEMVNITIPLTHKIPIYETVPWDEFSKRFNDAPALHKTVIDPVWGWSINVVEIVGQNVTFMRIAEINNTINPYGWDSVITGVDYSDGNITVQHKPWVCGGTTCEAGDLKVERFPANIVDAPADWNGATSVKITFNQSTNKLGNENLHFEIKLVEMTSA